MPNIMIPPRLRSRRLASAAATALLLAATPFVSAATASAVVPNPTLDCQQESYPPAGTPRDGTGKPYEAQFAATLNGGFLAVSNPKALGGVTFGVPEPQLGYPFGTLFGEACGLVNLPTLRGPIADPHPGIPAPAPGVPGNPNYNHDFILHGPPGVFSTPPVHSKVPPGFPVCDFRYTTPAATQPTTSGCDQNQPVPVGLTVQGMGNIPLIQGYGEADGIINAAILSPAAANGGFNVTFTNTAKATAVIDPSQVINIFGSLPAPIAAMLPSDVQGLIGSITQQFANSIGPTGGECTLAVGDLSQTGLLDPKTGKPVAATPAVSLGTNVAGGQPVTGPASAGIQAINPVTAGHAVAFANNFGAPAIDPNMPPDPGAPGYGMAPSTLCNPNIAQLFNLLLGLPAPPGDVTFSAPVGFSAHAAQ